MEAPSHYIQISADSPAPSFLKRHKKALSAVAILSVALTAVLAGVLSTHAHLKVSKQTLTGPNGELVPIGTHEQPREEIDPGTIILIGKEILQIIKDNEPVVNVASDLAAAVPPNVAWTQMAGWRGPKSWGPWVWSRINGFNTETVRYEFNFGWRYMGTFNGKGMYIMSATVENKKIYSAWAHNVDVSLKIDPPANTGTVENPVASMTLTVKMIVKTMINHNEQTCKAVLNGDGSGEILFCDDYILN